VATEPLFCVVYGKDGGPGPQVSPIGHHARPEAVREASDLIESGKADTAVVYMALVRYESETVMEFVPKAVRRASVVELFA